MKNPPFKFEDLIDIANLKELVNANHVVSGVPVGIIDAETGAIYASAGWQDIYEKFHRKNRLTRDRSIESDRQISGQIARGEHHAYRGQNGLWDIGIPIFCLDKHIATVFLGQFFYEDEKPDRVFFITQADQCGFDQKEYLAALERVPILRHEKVDAILAYNKAFAAFISTIVSNAMMVRQENEDRYKRLVENSPDILYSFSARHGGFYVSSRVEEILGYSPAYLMDNPFVWYNSIHPHDISRVDRAIEGFKTGQHFAIEYRIRDRNGDWHWFHDRSIGQSMDDAGVVIEGLASDITARKQADQALQVLTRKLEFAQQIGKSGWWEYDIAADRVIWPDETYALYGLDPDTTPLNYELLLRMIHPDYHDHHNEQLQRIYEVGQAEFQYPIILPDGTQRWIWARGETEYDVDGKPVRLFGTLQDVTERVDIEAQLRLQAQIIRQVHDSVISVDLDGFITSWNEGSRRLFGYTAKEVVGRHVDALYPEDSHNALHNEIIPTLLERGRLEMEVTLIRKGSKPFEAIVSLSVLRNDAGDLTGMIGYTLDVTERKRAQQALADSERRLADIIDFLPDPTWVIDLEGRVIAWNRAVEDLTGVRKQDILGKGDYAHALPLYGHRRPTLANLVLNRDSDWEAKYISLEEKNGMLTAGESFHPQLGGGNRYLSATAARLYDANGKTVGAIQTVRDITAAKKSEQEQKRLITELQDALDRVRTLSGLLPICASCKKIRDDKGYWNQIETYISDHTQAEFSHGICPACAKKLYSDFV